MSNAPALLYEDSTGTLKLRLKNASTLAAVISGVTIAVTITLAGAAVVTARSLTYDAAAVLWSGDDETGAWTCALTAAELATAGTYVATVTVTSGGVTVHTAVLRIPVVPDTGRRTT